MAVHAQAFNLIDNFCIIVAFLCARLCDFAAHVLKQVLRETLLFGHVVILEIIFYEVWLNVRGKVEAVVEGLGLL
jgi:hypothetical protein